MAETLGQFSMRVGKHPIGSSVDPDLLRTFVNDRIEQICRAFPWTRLKQQSILQTVAEYTTGTVSIVAGATAGTGSLTAFTSPMTGRFIRLANLLPPYTFTFVSPTSFTIDRPFEGPDDLVAAGFKIYKSLFELPSTLESIVNLRNLHLGYDINEETREWLDRNAASRTAYGEPAVYVPAEDSATGLQQIELYPAPIVSRGLGMDWRLKAPLFDLEDVDTDAEFPDWFSMPAMYAGVIADCCRVQGEGAMAQAEEQRFMMFVGQMQGEDARRMPPQTMRQADRYTKHRLKRARRGVEGDIWNWSDAGSNS
jgi:hypothetical protein